MLEGFKYLKETRKLTDETILKFHLGYCDPHGVIYIDSEFPEKDLKLDPRFSYTALFPIFDIYGTVIGVSARALDKRDLKYVNTVYPKTEHLYGLNVAWRECLRLNKVYIVEGNVDVIRLHQCGIKNVVGMLGSAVRERQLTLLSRFVENIIVVPDGDDAGRKTLAKIENNNDIREKLKINISVLTLPNGYDPDTYLLSHSAEEFYKLEKTTISSLQEKLKLL
jgi:DNA primase